MGESKYEGRTPGDWWAEGNYIAAHVEGGRPNGEVIGRMEPSVSRYREAGPANAKLAADAPELLRENEELRDLLESHGPEGHNVTNEQHVKLRAETLRLREAMRSVRGNLRDLGCVYGSSVCGPQDPNDVCDRCDALYKIDTALAATEPEVCRWRCDDHGLWWSACEGGVSAEFGDVVVEHNYCPKCGKPLKLDP